jgi:two-component system, OmpR family, sensor histidine kinase TctE
VTAPPLPPPFPRYDDSVISLRAQLSNWLFVPLFVLMLFSTLAGYVATLTITERLYDMALLDRAARLGAQLGLDYDRPPASIAEPDNAGIYFAVFDATGKVKTSNAELSAPTTQGPADGRAEFADIFLHDEALRRVTVRYRRSAVHPGGETILQMAEPVGRRQELVRGILAYIVIPQILFIVIVAAAVWFGLKHGFKPLERLRRTVANRRRDDLRPLDEMRAPDEVRPLIRTINDMLERQQQIMSAHRRFIADAAHQLRTPFAGLKTQAELALTEDQSDRRHEALSGILAGAERCNHLVNQLLTLARSEPLALNTAGFEHVDLNAIAQESAMRWVPEALTRNIDLGFEGAPVPVPVFGDRHSLGELFNALLDNAIRYTPNGGRVTVTTGSEDGTVVARVEDNGPGIPADQRERVFERFFRILGSGQPGCGLGLAIVREIATGHGATVAITDVRDGHGTCVTVRFAQFPKS